MCRSRVPCRARRASIRGSQWRSDTAAAMTTSGEIRDAASAREERFLLMEDVERRRAARSAIGVACEPAGADELTDPSQRGSRSDEPFAT